MKWYIAKLVYRVLCGDGNHTAQFDEQLRLIYASDPGDAHQKACSLGLQEEEIFFNLRQQPVKWQFIDSPEIIPVEKMMHGAEICSRIEEKEHPDIYIQMTREKAAALRTGHTEELLKPA